jgi:hypothetical protein
MENEKFDLQQAIKQDRQQRAREFFEYIEQGKEKFRCDIIAVPVINQEGRIIANIQIIPRD